MSTKIGRPRRFSFGEPGVLGPELFSILEFLDELAIRTEDQVNHLPPEALNHVIPPSTLSIGRLVLHLISADRTLLATALGGADEPPYAAQLARGLIADFATAPGSLDFAPSILKEHLLWRRVHLLDRCRVPGFLDRTVDHPACRTNRELLTHLVWHWSYHSGQIGLLAWEAGFDYTWTSAPRS